ncbi:MAG: BON domain-containing protein [Pirellulaceae bacterium]|jgi:hypothetical protein|nr:BON domain-containing protein [Thermoguttaceae bacterium]MDI9444026.1 BON domain-containing protein [Planctomycetota bacterium]NLY99628.1 BON domain-containing protein [Pirellulaceae bacterium]
MQRSIILPVWAILLSLAMGVAAEAQLFGERANTGNRTITGSQNRAMAAQNRAGSNVRQRISAGGNPGAAAEDVGKITGTERFLRESRTAGDFVGRSSDDVGGFVGAQTGAAASEIRSAIEGEIVRAETNPAVNRLLNVPQARASMYAPRLKIGFEPLALPTPRLEQSAAAKLALSPTLQASGPIEVSIAGRTATLRGAVASAHDKRLAGLMLLFEPGISKVENELTVAPATREAEAIPTPASP